MTKTERERLQEIACDLCHQPYACANEDELAKACEECPISAEMCEMEEEPRDELGKDINVPRWIPVTERLPEEYTRVIGFMAWKAMNAIEYQNGKWYSIDHLEPLPNEAVTHWMPLPNPPKEENDGT